ncbi:MAG: hypothetical protein HXX16_06310 [Bacteroidales bacterium]|nr:hypothetical protein [Bacteroidales bacterium]
MKTKKFIKISKVKKLKDSDLKNIKGGAYVLYGVHNLLYGVEPPIEELI